MNELHSLNDTYVRGGECTYKCQYWLNIITHTGTLAYSSRSLYLFQDLYPGLVETRAPERALGKEKAQKMFQSIQVQQMIFFLSEKK